MILPEYSKYIREVVIKLIVYREFFPDAYVMKKEGDDILFFPHTSETVSQQSMSSAGPPTTTTSSRALSFDEIAKKSCKGFAEIATNERYSSLRNFAAASDIQRKHLDYFELIEILFSLS